MQTREQQIELAIAVRIGELRRLARRTTKACAALGLGKKMPPDQHAQLRQSLLRFVRDVRRSS